MAKRLLIRLHASDQVDYLLQADDQSIGLSGSAFHPDQLPEFPNDAKVIVIVPGEDVLRFQFTLPKTSRAQLLTAVPYALEEQLIDDVDALHFVVGKQDADGDVDVAVVKKSLMQAWLSRCQVLDLQPTQLLPDYLCVPDLPDAWHLYLDEQRALLRQSSQKGMTVQQNTLTQLLAFDLNNTDVVSPQQITVSYDDANEYFEPSSLGLSIPVELQEAHCFPLALFTQGMDADFNLLQGEFQQRKSGDKKALIGKIAIGLLCLWGVVWLSSNIAEYYVYKHRLSAAEAQVATLYKQVFPQASSIVSPRLRITRLLASEEGGSKSVFLTLLTLTGQAINTNKLNITIESMGFRTNHLTLSVTANSFQTLNQLSQALQKNNISMQQQNASTKGKMVTAQLLIQEQG
jgi:general secretion pathway protein L